MSKVYSFRLDENNPREAQAREVIESWVAEGYSFRHVIVDALLSFHLNNHKNNKSEEIIEKIVHLLENMNTAGGSVKNVQSTLSDTFVGSISSSVKSGIRCNEVE
jgi:hypothetical protein